MLPALIGMYSIVSSVCDLRFAYAIAAQIESVSGFLCPTTLTIFLPFSLPLCLPYKMSKYGATP